MYTVRIACICTFFLVASAGAQISRTAGAIQGTVTDSTGAPMAQAQVTVRNTGTGTTRFVTTGANGGFHVSEVTVGEYEVRAQASGFTMQVRKGVLVPVGQTVELNFQLSPAGEQREITVSGAPPALDTTQATVTTAVDTERVEELPVHSRNYLNFVLLAPGVAAANTGSGTTAAASGFSFGGLRPRSNSLSIDGLENNDEFTGGSRSELSLETIREFQVVNSGMSAESGGASGGAINVVTKSGANIHHGDIFVFAQNGALDAQPPLLEATGKPDVSRYRAGGAIGGPIRRDRTFFYIAGEQEHTRTQVASDIDPALRTAINTVIAQHSFAGLQNIAPLATGYTPSALAETELSGKIDHQLSANNSLMARYAFTNNRNSADAFNTGGLVDASARGSAFIADHSVAASLASIISQSLVNDLRGQFATRRAVNRTGNQAGPGVAIAGIAEFGRPYAGNGSRRETHYDVSDTLSWIRGHHLIKTGAAVTRVNLRADIADGFGGLYVFPDLASFTAGSPDEFRQVSGNPQTDFGVTSFGAFVNDHWSATSWATLDVGMRYDVERLPAGLPQDSNDFAPRLGVAVTPAKNWVVRAGYGIFFDRMILAAVNRTLQVNGTHAAEAIAEGAAAATAFQSGIAPGGVAPSVYPAAPKLRTPYSEQASVAVERLLAPNLTVSATYQFVRGTKLARSVNVNLAPPVLLNAANAAALGFASPTAQQLGRELFGPQRIDPRYNSIFQWRDSATSTYNGLSTVLNRRMSNEIEFTGAYTWSKTIDDASDFTEQPQNPYDLRASRALSRFDQRHRFVFSGLFDLPFGDEEDRKPGTPNQWWQTAFGNLEVAPIVTIGSGRPVDPLTGSDSLHNFAYPLNVRPAGWGRNTLRTPYTANVDFRVLKYFPLTEHGKLDVVAEFFNLFNRTNVIEIDPVYGIGATPRSGFGRPLDASNPRQVQFSLDFEF
ncbi:MAG: TonB-dependent receptor [Terriglobales bacterium]